MSSNESNEPPFFEADNESEDDIVQKAILDAKKLDKEGSIISLDIPEEEGGLRRDLLAYFLGEIEESELRPFNKRELNACWTELDSRKIKPDDWRTRFADVQKSPLYQNDQTVNIDDVISKIVESK